MNTDKIYAQSIAKEYAKKSTSKVLALKKLDRKAKRPAEIFAYTFGIIATLIFGTGMCLAMKVIGNAFILGIVIGIIGLILVAINYPIYKQILAKRKEKYAFEIVTLANEIEAEEN